MADSLKTLSKLPLVLLAVCISSGSCLSYYNSVIGRDAQRFDLPKNRLPSGGRVAVLMRGQSFRGESGACDTKAKDRQLDGISSFVNKVLDPLNYELNNEVDVIAVDSQSCDLTTELMEVLNATRVHGLGHVDSATQGLAVQRSLQYFEKRLGGAKAISKYNLVIISRFDLDWWGKSITTWPGDFSRFNFPDMCPEEQRADPQYGEHCVSDLFQVMPGRLYPAWSKAVLTKGSGCFDSCVGRENTLDCHRVGHWCYDSVKKEVDHLKGQVGFAFHAEIPGGKMALPERRLQHFLRPIPLSLTKSRATVKEAGCCLINPKGVCCDTSEVSIEKKAKRDMKKDLR